MPDARQITYELKLEGHEPEELPVLDFEVREALSDGCTVRVRAACAKLLDGAPLLGKPGSLTVHHGDEAPRHFHGIIARVAAGKAPNDANLIDVEIRSRMWLLDLGRDNRIFTKTSARTVIEGILTKVGLPAAKQQWKAKDPPERPHILQREESDLAFVQRLLAREGIGYAIHSDDASESVLFFDDSPSLPVIAGDETLVDKAASGTGVDIVFELRETARTRSDAVMLRDYDPLLPGANLDVHAPASGGGAGREVYRHPGGYKEAAAGKKIAQHDLDALKLAGRTVSGRSDCPRLEAGRRFKVEGHRREKLNAAYVLVGVTHRGNVSEDAEGRHVAYENTFSAVAKEMQVRPPLAERPARGLEVAFVTVPGGEEIHVDEFGRVTVRFPWDRSGVKDDKSSNFLRVGQLALGGSMVLPRGDFEVLVDFELGELDRPYVNGHVYNGQSPAPYALPQGATCSSIQTATTSKGGGANEIRFEDSAGSEEIFLNASKDVTISVDNDARFTAGNNETAKVGVNTELKVGTDHYATVTSNRKLQVGATQSINVGGDLSETVGKTCDVQVGAARKVQCGGDHAENTTGTLTRTVGALQSVTGIKGVGRKIVGDSKVSAGAAWLETVGRSRGSEVKGSRTETVGALKLIKAKQVSVSCGATLTVNAAAEIVTCGGNRADGADGALAITAGGGLSVKAKNITIEGANTLVMILGACVIRLASSGKILIKAPTVELKGAKALGQIMHGSN
jgi:type VI secretion system secreted protein VgrG